MEMHLPPCPPTPSPALPHAGTAIWRAVAPKPAWFPSEPGFYCVFGQPPIVFAHLGMQGPTVVWQVGLGGVGGCADGGREVEEAAGVGSRSKQLPPLASLASMHAELLPPCINSPASLQPGI